MKMFKPLAIVVLAVGLLATTPAVAGASSDPSASWSDPMGGPAVGVGTGEQAEQGEFEGPATSAPAFDAAAVGDYVTISGAGNGHGVGMSQWGSQGRALAGQSYDQILADYYKGTTLATDTLNAPLWVNLENEVVKVYLKVEENVPGGAPVTVTRDDSGAYGGALEQVTLTPGDTLVVEYLDKNGPKVAPISNPRRCTFAAFDAGDDPATATPTFASAEGSCVIDLEWDGWNGDPTTRIVIDKRWQYNTGTAGEDCVHKVGVSLDCAYARGTMHIRPDDFDEPAPGDIGFHVVQELSLDDYARGIGEMPYSWDRDALKVQAVAGRTFARYLQQVYRKAPIERQWCWCSLYDKGPDQTYLGWGFDETSVFGSYAANWVAAVDETRGKLLMNNGRYMSANYSASNGGASENNEDIWGGTALTYLRSTSDPDDLTPGNPLRSWSRSVPVDYFAAKVGMDEVTSAQILATYDSGSPSDIAVTGTKNGSAVTKHYTAIQFMRLFDGTSYRLYAPRILAVDVPNDTPPPTTTTTTTTAPPAPAPFELDRLWGSDRYATAVEVSKDSHPNGSSTVYISTGENFPDALAVAPLAHQLGGPVLLTRTRSLPNATIAEIKRLGAKKIYILGGTAAVNSSVERGLKKYGTVTRIWGRDRYATAVEISKKAFPSGASVAYVAVGTNFPDALAGAPVAADHNGPMLLTGGRSLSGVTRTELRRLHPSKIIVLGGGTAISSSVVNELKKIAPVTSISAADRYASSVAIAKSAFPNGAETVYLATGQVYADALSGGPAAAGDYAPILLVSKTRLPSSVAQELVRLDPDRVVILGGTAAVSDSVKAAVAALFG